MPVAEDRAGITAIATIFGAASAYLIIVGLIMLFRSGMVSMAAGSALLGGLETRGPYMFLLAGGVGLALAFGLLRGVVFARRAAALLAIAGIVLLVPRVSAAVVSLHFGTLFWSGLGIIVRVVVTYYLYQKN